MKKPAHPSISDYVKDIVLPDMGNHGAVRNPSPPAAAAAAAAAASVSLHSSATAGAENTSYTGTAAVAAPAAASKQFLNNRMFMGAINRWDPQPLSLSSASPRAGDVLEILVRGEEGKEGGEVGEQKLVTV